MARSNAYQDTNGNSETPQDFNPKAVPGHSTAASNGVRITLQQAWRDVDLQFYKETGQHLMSASAGGKAGVLQVWHQKYQRDDSAESSRKFNHMSRTIQTILDGVEVIGAFAAQAASTVFAPAGMCFNAFAFLIDAPNQIRKVYDTLRELFEEISGFLVEFKILKRIDDKTALDEDLVITTNDILLSFVRICVLSIHLLQGNKFLTAAKAVFLKSDSGVSDELTTFRRLTQKHSMLTDTVTLEHVLRSEQDLKVVLSSSTDVQAKVASLAAAHTNEQTKFADSQRLLNIQRKLFTRAELWKIGTSITPEGKVDSLPQTITVLEPSLDFRRWIDLDVTDPDAIMLLGSTGTGKSYVLDAVREKLEDARNDGSEEASSTFVGHHHFPAKDPHANKSATDISKTYVLRSLAFQLASQSINYAKTLERYLQQHNHVHSVETIEHLWKILKLDTYQPSTRSTFFILIDGVEPEDENTVKTILNMALGHERQQKSPTIPQLCLRIFICATATRIGAAVNTLRMEDLNSSLLSEFVVNELKRLRIFQDTDRRSIAQRSIVQTDLPLKSNGNFHVARQKLEYLRKAIDQDVPDDQLSDIIARDIAVDEDQEAQRTIDQLETSLSCQHIVQLNTLLSWTIYNENFMEFSLSELEAALYLSLGGRTLEPISRKLLERFSKVFKRIDDRYSDLRFTVREPIQRLLRKTEDDQQQEHASVLPLFSLTINIQNAPEKDIRRFVWDLNEQMSSGKFEFNNAQTAEKKRTININKSNSHCTISKLCLKLLNEPPHETTKALIPYARDYLPAHLKRLRDVYDQITVDDKATIIQELIRYLSDPYYIEHECESFGAGREWLEADAREAILSWLRDDTILKQIASRERRWVQKVLKSGSKVSFLQDMASAVARNWSGQNHPNHFVEAFPMWKFADMYDWLKSFLKVEQELTSTEDTEADTLSDRVLKLIDWVQAEVKFEDDARRWMLTAGAFYIEDDFLTAISYFEKCPASSDHYWRALRGIQFSHSRREDDEARLSVSKKLVEVMDAQKKLGKLTENDLKEHLDTVVSVAGFCIYAQQYSEACAYFSQALEEEPGHLCRWRFIEALDYANRVEELMEMLSDWEQNPKNCGGKRPAESLLDLAERDTYSLMSTVQSVHSDRLRLWMFDILQECARVSQQRPIPKQTNTQIAFCGSVVAIPSHDAQLSAAGISLLENFVQHSAPTDVDAEDISFSNALFLQACECLTRCKFDEYRKRAESESSSMEECIAGLKSYITYIVKAVADFPPTSTVEAPENFLASLYAFFGRHDLARQHFAQAMAGYLDILCDDDLSNDSSAVEDMIRILCVTGDDSDAMIALSLSDRGEFLFWRECGMCGYQISRSNHAICCICRYCSSFMLCDKCYTRVIVNKEEWRSWRCSLSHEWVTLHHWEYSEEELAPGKVRIDYQVEKDAEGREERIGGKVVDIAEWVGQLRTKWKLLPPSSAVEV